MNIGEFKSSYNPLSHKEEVDTSFSPSPAKAKAFQQKNGSRIDFSGGQEDSYLTSPTKKGNGANQFVSSYNILETNITGNLPRDLNPNLQNKSKDLVGSNPLAHDSRYHY